MRLRFFLFRHHFFLLAALWAFFARAAKDVRGCFFFKRLYSLAYRLLYALALRLTLGFSYAFLAVFLVFPMVVLEEPRDSPQFGQKLGIQPTSVV